MERRLNRRKFVNPREQAAFIISEFLKNNKHVSASVFHDLLFNSIINIWNEGYVR